MRAATLFGIICVVLSVPLLWIGLYSVLVEYNVEVKFLGRQFSAIKEHRRLLGEKSMIDAMWSEHAYLACAAITTFGIVIPLAKFVLFSLWLAEIGGIEGSVKVMKFAQSISKWAAVDACVEAITVGMLLKLNGVNAQHGVAFLSFVLYCIVSSVAFLCLPGEIQAEESEPNTLHLWMASKMNTPRKRVIALVLSLTTFVMLLSIAGGAHITRMWVPKEGIRDGVWDNPGLQNVPNFSKEQIVDQIARQNQLSAKVSLAGAIHRLFSSGHLYTMCGSVLLMFCVVFLPLLYAVITACKVIWITDLASDDQAKLLLSGEKSSDLPFWPVIDRVRVFAKDLSMLDVMTVGIFVATIVTTSEHDIKCELGSGYKYMCAAALAWYVHDFMCRSVQACVQTGLPEPNAEPPYAGEPVAQTAF